MKKTHVSYSDLVVLTFCSGSFDFKAQTEGNFIFTENSPYAYGRTKITLLLLQPLFNVFRSDFCQPQIIVDLRSFGIDDRVRELFDVHKWKKTQFFRAFFCFSNENVFLICRSHDEKDVHMSNTTKRGTCWEKFRNFHRQPGKMFWEKNSFRKERKVLK